MRASYSHDKALQTLFREDNRVSKLYNCSNKPVNASEQRLVSECCTVFFCSSVLLRLFCIINTLHVGVDKSDASLNMLLQLVPTNLSRVVIVKFAASLLSDLRQTSLSQQVSHSIISICNIIKMQNSKSRRFIFKNSSDFQFTDVCYRYISLI